MSNNPMMIYLVYESDGDGTETIVFATSNEQAAQRACALTAVTAEARVQPVSIDDTPLIDFIAARQHYIAASAAASEALGDSDLAAQMRAQAAAV